MGRGSLAETGTEIETGTLKSLIMLGIKGTFNKLLTGSYKTGIVGEELVA